MAFEIDPYYAEPSAYQRCHGGRRVRGALSAAAATAANVSRTNSKKKEQAFGC
jgi:hypothetical protein